MINIVLIDDDKVSTYVTEKFIQRSVKGPCHIFKFSTATEALEKVSEINPNYLFVDLLMPEMTGWDFLDNLGPELMSEIYILSGSVDHRDIEKAGNHKRVRKFLSKLSLKESISGIFQN